MRKSDFFYKVFFLTLFIVLTTIFTARSQDKREWLNVQDYGADPSGLSDSTVAIQKTFDSVKTGNTVYFPKGVYKIKGNIHTSCSNLVISGEGTATSIIEQTADGNAANGLSIWHDDVTVENLQLRTSEKISNRGMGIEIRIPGTSKDDLKTVRNIVIQNLHITGFKYGITGVLLQNALVTKCRVSSGAKAAQAMERGTCIQLAGDNMTISDNTLESVSGAVTEHNIYITGGAGVAAERKNISIIGNLCIGKKRACGIQAWSASWTDLTIENNHVDMDGGGLHGIGIGYSSGSQKINRLLIRGNTIENVKSDSPNSGNGIMIAPYKADEILIEKNIIKNTSNAAIRLLPSNGGEGFNHFTIRENDFETWSAGRPNQFPAVILGTYSSDASMSNGLLEKNTYKFGDSREKVRLWNRNKTKYKNVQTEE